MLKIAFGKKFDFYYRVFSNEHPKLLEEVDKRVSWFRRNPIDTRLRNHALRKRMKGKYAFWITNDIRIVYEWLGKTTVRFLAIGGHKLVYSHK